MRRRLRFGYRYIPALIAGLCFAGLSVADAQQSASQAVTGAALTTTSGVVKASQQLDRMLLLLQGSAAQQKALDTLLAAQLTTGDASYHKWLTPAQFATQFAPSASDAAKVAQWLQSQGFTVAALPASRGWIEFSGTASQVQQAFGASITIAESSSSGDETRFQLAGDAKIPAAIASQVKGLVSLDGALSVVAVTTPVEMTGSVHALAAETSLSGATSLTPNLAKSWLQLSDSKTAPTRGTGETIAIPSRSNVRPEDFAAFRNAFSLPDATLQVTLSGTDPGRTADEAATMQAASWAGTAAPAAQIAIVPAATTNATDGFDLALAATIDGALAHTISVGYSACESSLSAAHQAFYAALYRQAAAEGIAVIAATGDSGAAACHLPGDASLVSTGYQVNALASTPWNTAIGAVGFAIDGKSLTGWQSTSSGAALYATGGGASSLYATPSWQVAAGIPASDPGTTAAHHRYLPDLSLPTAVSAGGQVSQGLAFCLSGDTASSGCRLVSAGGSANSAALFSGIAADLAQQYGAQGNLAANLYGLTKVEAAKSASDSAFVDVTAGNAQLQCVVGSVNCEASGNGEGLIGFTSATGYDLASGLGAVNAEVLIADWAKTQAIGTAAVTVAMTSATGITYNPTSNITLSATVSASSGATIPTGTVQFYDETTSANVGTAQTLSSTGTVSYVTEGALTSGGHNIQARYSGDTTFEAASSQPVIFEIQPSATSVIIKPSTTSPAGGASVTVTGTVTATNLGTVSPTGTLTINLDGVAQGAATLATASGVTSGALSVTMPASGSHTIQGIYSGDSNYNTSTSPSVTVAVAKTASVTTISATPSTLTSGTTESFTATLAPATTVTGTTYVLTGTVSFYDASTTLLGTATVSGDTAILTGITLSATASHTVTAVYSGDTTYSTSTSAPLLLSATLLPVTVTLTESSTVLVSGQPVTLTATVTPVNTPALTIEQNPSGYVLFYAGTTLISGQVPIVQSTGYSSVASFVLTSLTAGTSVITAQYFGDTTYGAAVSNSVTLQSEDFGVSCNVTNVNVVQGATASPSPVCTVASLGGLTGDIQITCAEQNPPLVGAIACNFNPTVIATSGVSTLSIATTAGNLAGNKSTLGGSAWSAAGGGVALAFAGLLLSPIGRRARWLRGNGVRLMAWILLLGGLAATGIGCTNTSNVTINSGTPLGVHTLKITAGAVVNTVTVTHVTYITVNVTQ
jgi:trimeric autotransporter adhesin